MSARGLPVRTSFTRVASVCCSCALGVCVLAPSVVFARALQEPAQITAPARITDAEVRALFERAAAGDESAELALVERGEDVARAALAGLQGLGPVERRARARVVELAGGEHCIDAALQALADPDAGVRATLVRFLSRAELALAGLDARIGRLGALARGDPDPDVRAASAHALVEIGGDAALSALDSAVDDLAGDERAQVAALVAGTVRGQARARARLERAAQGAESPAVFAALLTACARSLAESEHGFESAADRAPILAGLRHPDPLVRRSAQAAIDTLVNRLVALQEFARADAVLLAFEGDGLDTCRSLEERVRVALLDGRRDDDALVLVRALGQAVRVKDGVDGRAWRGRAAGLEAVVQIARGDLAGAAEPAARAAECLDSALAARLDLSAGELRREQVRLLLERANVAVCAAVRLLALAIPVDAKAPPDSVDPRVLSELRRAHALALEAQLCGLRGDTNAPSSLDAVIASGIGVHELVLDVQRHPAWPAARSMALRIALGRALASVAPLEMIGFEPYPSTPPECADPTLDPVRRELLVSMRAAECDQLAEELSKERRKELRTAIEDPIGNEPEARLELLALEWRLDTALEAQRRVRAGDFQDLSELRTPSSFAAWTARALRDEGRAGDGRPFLLLARAQLDASEAAQRFYWGLEMRAEIEMMLGSSWSDDGDPAKAELELSKAVERLNALEDALRENGASPAIRAMIKNQRCSALVALAVNANVKRHDPKAALVWFEAAWKLREDDFMRVLLACYRARDGKTLAARALMREVTPGPATWYNLACTYALLGDRDDALFFLQRELEENHPTPGALARQKEWARSDPDLASLRDDPRFRALVGDAK